MIHIHSHSICSCNILLVIVALYQCDNVIFGCLICKSFISGSALTGVPGVGTHVPFLYSPSLSGGRTTCLSPSDALASFALILAISVIGITVLLLCSWYHWETLRTTALFGYLGICATAIYGHVRGCVTKTLRRSQRYQYMLNSESEGSSVEIVQVEHADVVL